MFLRVILRGLINTARSVAMRVAVVLSHPVTQAIINTLWHVFLAFERRKVYICDFNNQMHFVQFHLQCGKNALSFGGHLPLVFFLQFFLDCYVLWIIHVHNHPGVLKIVNMNVNVLQRYFTHKNF